MPRYPKYSKSPYHEPFKDANVRLVPARNQNPKPSTSGVSEIATCLPSPIADDPLDLSSLSPLSSNQ